MHHRSKQGAAARLKGVTPPHPDRVQTIKTWHLTQAANTSQEPVALLNLVITAAGEVECTGLGIEPAHAQVLLAEMEKIRERLEAFCGSGCDRAPIVELRRSA